eukprot:CAMPEP_0182923566 /NCGR_PEP_ID=MMETSP0105_2-20130417/5515_1 /TAXON_ID=81532 ORGANISM="Acanthoeca-like sp., Strain 10tr" /NCGR_SAMPLE_ID=MMETSP0105_2 /ASSEMBLY_ACC=CAM_ASM_000205 /LENGTH=83 /DNA_ID=CAMNT_0025061293 /DNA_START=560 /DNA_END=807 /DNA_ORIENTATION=-
MIRRLELLLTVMSRFWPATMVCGRGEIVQAVDVVPVAPMAENPGEIQHVEAKLGRAAAPPRRAQTAKAVAVSPGMSGPNLDLR